MVALSQRTMLTIFVVIVTVLAVAAQRSATSEDVSNIRLLHVICRHGERAPADTYPNDPYVSYPFLPYGWGQLTTVGRVKQFETGQFVRKRYDQFLGKIYHPDIVAVETTEVDRAVMSAQLQMAGMWPPAAEQRWHEYLDWQPISMKIDHLNTDKLLLVRIPCAPYSMELERVLKSDEVQEKLRPYQEMMNYLEKQTGKSVKTADDVADIYSTLNAEEQYGLTLPEWTKGTFPDLMEYLTTYSFVLNVNTPFLQRIKGGPLLKKILTDSKAASSHTLDPPSRKLFMYAGHDSTVVNVLSALRVWEHQVPGFGIMALIEVHEDPRTQEYGLKVFLRNSTLEEPYPLEIPDCGYFCPLTKLEKLYEDVLPDDLLSECKSDDPNYVPPPPSGP